VLATIEIAEVDVGMNVVFVGMGLAVVGLLVLFVASPSPHGYIEVFIGLPLVLAGTLTLGVGLARLRNPMLRTIGWLVLIALPIALGFLIGNG
jgi:hypothetical protein